MADYKSLDLTEDPFIDDSIFRYQFGEYTPQNGTNINDTVPIKINIEMTDSFFKPSKAYIQVEGRLQAASGASYADIDVVTLTHNGIMHLFDRMAYDLSGQNIETVSNLGQATTMLGMLKYSNDFQLAEGLNQLWYKDTVTDANLTTNVGFTVRQAYIIKKPATKGTFSFCIPLNHIFGFCEDYTKVIYGFKHTLTLQRKNDNDAIFRSAAAAIGKVNLTKVSLWMPYVTPSDKARLTLNTIISNKAAIPVAFYSRSCETITPQQTSKLTWKLGVKSDEKPRYIIVGFQTNRDNDQTQNASIFDHCNLTNMQVVINNIRYPEADYELSFSNQQVSRAYTDLSNFKENFCGIDKIISNCNITPSDYRDLYPLFVFDLRHQSERLKASSSDIVIIANFSENVPVGTEAFAIVRVKRVKKEKVIKEKKKAGRPRINPIKEKKERYPKYDWLAKIRTNPTTIKLTNIETGEVKIYNSLYDYIRKEKHCKSYAEKHNGKVKNGVKIEIIKSENEK
ncbi:uncharacterized protein LOC124816340 [Hydra vulgaris]|uniref:uncharacterized protein LOC124816340 n=1 Tax=Hydra vulgaris TaxID=6087 RepID=UPI0032EA3533